MARPTKCRRVCTLPPASEFTPAVPQGAAVEMTVDEYAALCLVDEQGLSQEACAQRMGVGRTTAQAICDSARHKVATALSQGRPLHIDGGAYALCPRAGRCKSGVCSCIGCGIKNCGKHCGCAE